MPDLNGGFPMDYVTLNNGVKMPMEGFGVFRYLTLPNVSRRCWTP